MGLWIGMLLVLATPVASVPLVSMQSQLTPLGGIVIASDHKDFGGLSGLRWRADPSGRSAAGLLYAISDRAGRLFVLTPLERADGRLHGVSPPIRAFTLPGDAQKDLDAEALEFVAGGGLLLGVEDPHRLLGYAPPSHAAKGALRQKPPMRLPAPWVQDAPDNKGPEALALTPDGGLLVVLEGGKGPQGGARAFWQKEGVQPRRFELSLPEGFQPTDAVALNDDLILLVARFYKPLQGHAALLLLLPVARFAEGALIEPVVVGKLAPPVPLDNMEGLAARPLPGGGWDIYMISDDNFSPLQKTLLLKFRLRLTRL